MKEKCLFCGSSDLILYYPEIPDRLHMSSKYSDFFRCKKCGSLQLIPLPTEKELKNLYPKSYAFKKEIGSKIRKIWNNFEWQIFYKPVFASCVKIISKETGVYKGLVIDIGCGSGLRLQQFRQKGYEVEGIDFSQEDINYAENVLGLKVWQANIEEDSLPVDYYNLIVTYWLLEHLKTPIEFVMKAKKSLIKDGWIAFAVPLTDSWLSRLFRSHWSSIREAPRHICIPTSKGMFTLLKNNGFINIKARPVTTLELAIDVALTIWPKGNFVLTQGKRSTLKIIDRIIVAIIACLFFPLTWILKKIGIKQSLTIFLARRKSE